MRTLRRVSEVRMISLLVILPAISGLALGAVDVSGHITDPQGKTVAGAEVKLILPNGSVVSEVQSDDAGEYALRNVEAGLYRLSASGTGFLTVDKEVTVVENQALPVDLQFEKVEAQSQSVVISAKVGEPSVDLRNSEV